MQTHVEFRSDKFPSFENDIEGVNWSAGVYGKRLADYLVKNFPLHGIRVARHLPEDWGWYIEIEHKGGFALSVGCGSYQEYENGFLCFVEPSKPTVWRWFKKIDVTDDVEKVTTALHKILTNEPGVSSLRWWDENER
jgi:hypothetical protein